MTYPDTYVTKLYWQWEKRKKQLMKKMRNPRTFNPAYGFWYAQLSMCQMELATLKAQLIDWEIRRGIMKKPTKKR